MRLAKMLLGLLALAVLCFVAAYANAAPAPRPKAAVARKIVKFSPQTPMADRLAIAGAHGRVVRTLDLIDAVVIEAPVPQMQFSEVRLRSNTNVVRVDDDPKINWLVGAAAAPAPALPSVSEILKQARKAGEEQEQAQQETPWGIKRVNARGGWAASKGGKGVKVVVIDTGIDFTHPDLAANFKGGWNAIDKSTNVLDDNGHGTHCAGTIAALDDGQGVVGVAPQASLYSVKVLDADGSGTFSDVIAGMLWAVENKMQVASMSLGASVGNESLKEAVEKMAKAGVVLIAAAGNSGSDVGFPAAYPGAIAIAAMDSSDKVAYFSSRGPEVALIAPGVDVKSTYMGGGYDTLSGTSMATPHVSGLAALALGTHKIKAGQVRAALIKAAEPLKDVPATEQGAGVPDAAKLVSTLDQ